MRSSSSPIPFLAACFLGSTLLGTACSSSEETAASPPGKGGGPGGADASAGAAGSVAAGGAGGGASGTDAATLIEASLSDAGLTPDVACAQTSAEATLVKKPVDIIFVIDNSGSMTVENAAVVSNVNQNFAQIIQASGIDYRVIMVTSHTSGNEVKIGPPLSAGATDSVPGNNPPIFYHYDRTVSSHNSLCLLLDTYAAPDIHKFGQGWGTWLRPEAFKLFVEITDDGVNCSSQKSGKSYGDSNTVNAGQTAAEQWDADLMAMDPAQFGTAQARNYVFFSIVGMSANVPADEPWEPTDPVITTQCLTAADPGTGYQWLSNMTGGLKFPVCEGSGFDAVFKKLAEGVIEGAKVACDFKIPDPPQGQDLDPNTITVLYTPSDGGPDVEFTQVDSIAQCTADAFYVQSGRVRLCPGACTLVQSDSKAKLQVLFACKHDGPA